MHNVEDRLGKLLDRVIDWLKREFGEGYIYEVDAENKLIFATNIDRHTLDALRYAEENWPYVRVVAIWAFRYPAPTLSYMDYYTLVTPEFIPKPIYTALRSYTGNADPAQ